MAVYSTPTTISLGEVRTMTTPAATPVMILGTTPVQVTSIALETVDTRLSLTGTPGPTPVAVQLHVTPTADGDLANAILVTSNAGMLRIPITGKVVTADFTVPPVISLGTFCVNASTTSSVLALSSTGTATIRLSAPHMVSTSSAFDLSLSSPSSYPSIIMPGAQATVGVTPKRQSFAGGQHDEIVWSTDVANRTEERTMVSALFVADGGAIAPSSLMFGKVPIHLDTMMPHSVTLQNCDTTPIMIADPELDPPFTIDSPNFPHMLAPNETATFSVGFHPTKLGVYVQTMRITSMQLHAPLEVSLTGEAISGGGDGDGGTGDDLDPKSFYGCSGCSTREPSGGLLIGLAFAAALRRRRRP
jgi:MYXO-CTERM domain-containing protein